MSIFDQFVDVLIMFCEFLDPFFLHIVPKRSKNDVFQKNTHLEGEPKFFVIFDFFCEFLKNTLILLHAMQKLKKGCPFF